MPPDLLIREAVLADIPEIIFHRQAMFEDMGVGDSTSLAEMLSASEPYLRQAMGQGSFRGWLAVASSGQVAGGGAVVISFSPPHPWDIGTRRAAILNLYTYPAFRRQGIARELMQTMIEWCKREGFGSISLHASQYGRPLYETLGFQPTNEMRLRLK
jgi:GNAT superfamily N-acetyltransferase